MRILLTGVPGSGKSYLGKSLSKKFSLPFFSLTDFIVENKLYTKYDSVLNTFLYEDDIVEEALLAELPPTYIVECHSPLSVINIPFTHIVYLTVPLAILHRIYKEREYGKEKIGENIDSACLDIIREEIEEAFPSTPYVDYDRTVDTIDDLNKFFQ